MRETSLVSVIVRTKDRPKLLRRALQSIAAQTYRPIEVMLVNDGGCDLNIEELKTILGDVSLHYIRLEKNEGRAVAGNVGIENAKGEYIGFLDDDDEFHPKHLATLTSFLEQSDYKVAYTDSLMVYKEYNPETRAADKDVKKETVFSQDFNYDKLVFENYIPFMCLLFRRGPLIVSGGFDRSLELYEDWDLLVRIGKKHPFYHIRQLTANYNQWSVDFQISQVHTDSDFSRQAYLKVLSRHISEITPKSIHGIVSEYAHMKQILKKLREESELKVNLIEERDARIEGLSAEVKEKDWGIKRLSDELQRRDTRIEALSAEIKEKEARMSALSHESEGKDSQINNLISALKERDSRIDSLISEIREKDARINTLSAELRERDSRVEVLSAEAVEKDARINSLSTELKGKDAQIEALAAEVKEKDARINTLSTELQGRDYRISDLFHVLEGKDFQINNFFSELKEIDSLINVKETEIAGLKNVIRERDALINAMCNTRGWRLLEKFRRVRDNFPIQMAGMRHHRDTRTGG